MMEEEKKAQIMKVGRNIKSITSRQQSVGR
jgi:hypothetical protein